MTQIFFILSTSIKTWMLDKGSLTNGRAVKMLSLLCVEYADVQIFKPVKLVFLTAEGKSCRFELRTL